MFNLSSYPKKRVSDRKVWNSFFESLGGQRWIRTTEGVSQQIYSLPHLATLVFARFLGAKIGITFEAAKQNLSFL